MDTFPWSQQKAKASEPNQTIFHPAIVRTTNVENVLGLVYRRLVKNKSSSEWCEKVVLEEV